MKKFIIALSLILTFTFCIPFTACDKSGNNSKWVEVESITYSIYESGYSTPISHLLSSQVYPTTTLKVRFMSDGSLEIMEDDDIIRILPVTYKITYFND